MVGPGADKFVVSVRGLAEKFERLTRVSTVMEHVERSRYRLGCVILV
jgi:hypothetical protein